MPQGDRIQWFPGHMAKTRRLMKENLKLVDLVIEIADARIPISSRNPEFDSLIENKPHILVLNKSDMADPALNDAWKAYFQSKGIPTLCIDCKSGKGVKSVLSLCQNVLGEKLEQKRKKGIVGPLIRIMVVGIPNVGKSSFINRIAGGRRAKVEDRPGVTRGKQWVKVEQDFDLLDMPGVLWPKFEDPGVGLNLAFTGAVKDQVIDIETLAVKLIGVLRERYRSDLESRYQITDDGDLDDYELLQLIGKKRGMLLSKGEIDTERAAIMLLDEFRGGKLGRITLEKTSS